MCSRIFAVPTVESATRTLELLALGLLAAARREHDHHGLLDARDDRVRAPQARQGVVQAQGDPGGDHVVGERAQPDHPVPGGGRRGLPPQARPPLRRVPALQPDQIIARHLQGLITLREETIFCFSFPHFLDIDPPPPLPQTRS